MTKDSSQKGSGKVLLVVLVCCASILIAAVAAILVLYNKQKKEQVITAAPVEAVVTAQATVLESEKDRIAVATANLSIHTPEPDPEAEYEDQALLIKARTTMLQGVSIGGIDVSGLTREQARERVASAVLDKTEAPAFILTHNGSPYTISEKEDTDEVDPDFADEVDEPVSLEVSVDVDTAIQTAFNMLRESDSNVALVNEAAEIARTGLDIPLNFKLDEEDVILYVATIAEDLDVAPINASVRSENKKLVYTDAQVGYGVDRDALVSAILAVDPTEPVQIEIPMAETDPLLTQEMLQTQYVLRGSYSTSFSGSTSNRKFNIRKGTDLINGTILQPGEVFSTNGTLGVRTKANGWKRAGAYESGKVVQQAGGGVCQLSGTLYNAAVLSDLEIVERKNHSMPVHYLDKGRDATINSVGNIIDFKFKNNTESPIIVIGYTEGNKLHFEIYGEPMGHGEYDTIKIRTKQTGSTKIKTNTTEDNTKPVGYSETVSSGSIGYSYESYKEYYKDGKKIKTEFLAASNYKMFPKEVIIGTKPTEPPATEPPKEDPAPTPKPTKEPENPNPPAYPTNTPKPTDEPKDPEPPEKDPSEPTKPPQTDPPKEEPPKQDPPKDPEPPENNG